MSRFKSEAKRRKANEDERKRMKRLKGAYDELQSHLPSCRDSPQGYMPKVKILRQATEYIRTLDMILNFPFLIPSNGLESGPKPTRHVSSDQIQPHTQRTGSSLLTENKNHLFTSDEIQIDEIFQMARERKGCFLFNSARSASHLLKQMAEASKKSTSHENALSLGKTPASPYPCKCHSLPLRHLEISDESVDQEEMEPEKLFPSQPKEDGSFQRMPFYSQSPGDNQNKTPDLSQAETFLSHSQNSMDLQENVELDSRLVLETARFNPCDTELGYVAKS